MVPSPVRRAQRAASRLAAAGVGAAALTGCGARDDAAAALGPAERVVAAVQAQYTGRDAVAAGAWTWTGPDSLVWVMIDVQSAMPGVVQARAELWLGDTTGVLRVGRSDVMAAAAEFGAYAFDDLTGDGIPDLLGYVADSSATSYPVFISGARGAMADLLEEPGRGYRFSTAEDTPPQVAVGPRGPCAIQLWAEATPDSAPPGWRYLAFGRQGALLSPSVTRPECP